MTSNLEVARSFRFAEKRKASRRDRATRTMMLATLAREAEASRYFDLCRMAPLPRTPETQHRVHFQDCDMLGHLNNARYLDYFLNAREDQVAEHYALNMGELARGQQAAWVITKHQLSYLKPARQGVLVRILTQLIHFDNSNLVVEMQMRSRRRPAPAGPAVGRNGLCEAARRHPHRPRRRAHGPAR